MQILDLKISRETNHKILTPRDFRCTIKCISINKYPNVLDKYGLGHLATKDYIVKDIKEKNRSNKDYSSGGYI